MDDLMPPRLDAVAPSLPGAEAARALGRRRRRRQELLSAAALSTVAVVAVALSSGGDSGRQTLVPGVVATASASATASSQAQAPVAASPTPTPLPSAVASALASALPSSRPLGPKPTPTSQPAPPRQRGITNGPEPTVTRYDASRQCDGSGPTAGSGYCSYYDGVRTARAGTRAELAASVCRLPGQLTGTLRAASGEYAHFAAGTVDAGTLWDSAHGRRFGTTSRTWQVQAGTCLRFALVWDLRGNDGTVLPRGSYRLDARPYVEPDEASAGAVVAFENVETLTIT